MVSAKRSATRRLLPGRRPALLVGTLGCALGVMGAGSSGCGPKPAPYPQSISAPDALQRIHGIIRAGEDTDTQVVPLLVDRLEDEDEAVRFYAILSLEKIVGTRLGYEYGASEPDRRKAVERWREYVSDLAEAGGPRAGSSG